MNDRSHLLTEQRNPASINLDAMSISDTVALFNAQDQLAVAAVAKEQPNITRAVELVAAAFKSGGRLFYIGAGTSGRLGVLDASECPPTFRADPSMVQGIIAGGEDAMFRPQEGAEDSPTQAAADLDARHLAPNDVVMGIATGGTTPYVHGGLRHAKKIGAKTIFFSCVQPFPDETPVDVVIRPLTGPEILTGSTRLKAGTATKLVLNAITTIAMVQIGKCYENLMVDLRASNSKLRDRAARILCTLASVPRDTALKTLDEANGHVKLAILMLKKSLPAPAAQQLLDQSNGHLRQALACPIPGSR